MVEFVTELQQGAAARGIALPPEAAAGMEAHQRLLLHWNRTVRLTSPADARRVVQRHFLESLEALPFLRAGAGTLVDVGSGNGFPALPLLLLRPEIEGTLLEPTGKKRAFLKEVLRATGLLDRVRVIPDRVDRPGDLARLAPFDHLTLRAVGGLAAILEGAATSLAPGGRAILFLGDDGLRTAGRSALRVERIVPLSGRSASYLAVLTRDPAGDGPPGPETTKAPAGG